MSSTSTPPRPQFDYDHEAYGRYWFDHPELSHVFHPDADRLQRLLDEDVARERDRLEAEIYLQRLDEWLESAGARDYLAETEE